ncbi:MAG TPA: helix-turn-helix domain-containing protein [Stellaceae bacterium]|nr:helix-turn-helix domain-containing protein [Stellaceae bacterium]
MKSAVYSVEETAKKFDVNVKTVYEGIAKKEIPKVPGLGRAIKIPRAWVDAKLAGEAK